MTDFPKIQTVFLRDPATKHRTLLDGMYARPEFAYLAGNRWTFTEKVDGTNIRVIIRSETDGPGEAGRVTFAGKTDHSMIPARLLERLQARFQTDAARAQLSASFPAGGVLYGEGFGDGIQGSAGYSPYQDFVLFDVRVGRYWLERSNVQSTALALDLPIVPIIGQGSLLEMVAIVRQGFTSRWGNFPAEGIVARPAVELATRGGERIITKLKAKDFKQEN